MKTGVQRDSFKLLFWLIKYTPIISAFLLWLHITLQVAGFDDKLMDHLVAVTMPRLLLMMVASFAFGFCWVHRAFIAYNGIASAAIYYNNEVGFTDTLLLHQVLLVGGGAVLLITLFIHWEIFIKRCGDAKTTYHEIAAQGRR